MAGYAVKLLRWFLKFFSVPKYRPTPRLKFVEGTEWTCPECHKLLGVAKQDVYYGARACSSEWEVHDEGFFTLEHCGVRAMRISSNPIGRIELHTPTGWVG